MPTEFYLYLLCRHSGFASVVVLCCCQYCKKFHFYYVVTVWFLNFIYCLVFYHRLEICSLILGTFFVNYRVPNLNHFSVSCTIFVYGILYSFIFMWYLYLFYFYSVLYCAIYWLKLYYFFPVSQLKLILHRAYYTNTKSSMHVLTHGFIKRFCILRMFSFKNRRVLECTLFIVLISRLTKIFPSFKISCMKMLTKLGDKLHSNFICQIYILCKYQWKFNKFNNHGVDTLFNTDSILVSESSRRRVFCLKHNVVSLVVIN